MTKNKFCVCLIVFAVAVAVAVPVQAQVAASYMYYLSDFSGPVSSQWARIAVDQQEGEVYALNRTAIQIYNQSAMQVFGFGENLRLSAALDIASAEGGDMFVLYRSPAAAVQRLNYRGELLENIRIDASGQGIENFSPNFIDYRSGRLYLADAEQMLIVVASATGDIEQSYDFKSLIAGEIEATTEGTTLNDAQRRKASKDLRSLSSSTFNGFSVDSRGNLYFTVPTLFFACRVNPQGEWTTFGVSGGAPGKFGVVASIVADSQGNIFVSDRLRSVVLMFDRNLNFQTEFGYRGSSPQNLIVPDDIALDESNNRIYVSQAANRGVSVFTINQ